MLKRYALVLVAFLALAMPIAVSAGEPPRPTTSEQTKECVVYITRTGHKYHKDWCRYLRQSKIAVSRSAAIQAGYTPCSVCGGSDCER